ncbi:hypothetical protein [Streptomyces sp. NRRL WC-3774]|nr:hypothetical protein [Streptomyces sp. NRRL WC-3774]
MANDKYGIPPGGNNGPYSTKYWAGIHYALPWQELLAGIALAGWKKDQWATAAAVCAAESGRNPFVYNTYKKGHFGLFQISRAAWPAFFPSSGDMELQWCAPWLALPQAYKIWQQQGWKAWEGYTNGRYLSYLPVAKAQAELFAGRTGTHGGDEIGYWKSLSPSKTTTGYVLKAAGVTGADLAGVATSGLADAVAGATGATANATVDTGATVAQTVNQAFGWLPDLYTALTTPALWMRFAYGITGVVLVTGGLLLVVRSRPGVQAAAKTVASVVPGGAALKSVKGGTAA